MPRETVWEIAGCCAEVVEVIGSVGCFERPQDPLAEKIRELEAAKRILEDVEVKALSGVALALTEAAESLSRTVKELADMRTAEWMTAEQASTYLRSESAKAFEKIAAREGIPKHYLSARTTRYNRTELDAWLLGRRGTAPG